MEDGAGQVFKEVRDSVRAKDVLMLPTILRVVRYGLMAFVAYGIVYQFPC